MTLIKVPVYIMVAFFIFNLFAFTFIYFKMLGISYIVQQTAIENNYLPKNEVRTIANYMNNELGKISMVENAGIIYGEGSNDFVLASTCVTNPPKDGAFHKQQYGKNITCGVSCNYIWIWPLDYRATKADKSNVKGLDGYNGISGQAANNPYLQQEAAAGRTYDQRASKAGDMTAYMRQNKEAKKYSDNNITIKYTLPGLKYDPDL